jgi:hypothetical protein
MDPVPEYREVLNDMKKKREDIKVFISHRESVCDECKENLGRGAWIMLVRDKGALCLSCAETKYDKLLSQGWDRWEARAEVEGKVLGLLDQWSKAT